MMRSIALAAALVLGAAAAAPQRVPNRAPHRPTASAAIGEWNMQTDRLSANMGSGRFSAPDHVTLTRADGSVIQADRATGNYKQRQAALYGHVSLRDTGGTFGLKSAQGAQSRGPATLTADEMHVDDTARLYDAAGSVHYEQGDTSVDAQTAHLNDATHDLNLAGKVHVVQGDRTLYADRAAYNTQTGNGTADSNVTMTFPGITPTIATPKPIVIKKPKIP